MRVPAVMLCVLTHVTWPLRAAVSLSRTREGCACPAFLTRLFQGPEWDSVEQGIADSESQRTSTVSSVLTQETSRFPITNSRAVCPCGTFGPRWSTGSIHRGRINSEGSSDAMDSLQYVYFSH